MWSVVQTLLASSQYPVFKVQAQRGDTLRVFRPAVNAFSRPFSSFLATLVHCGFGALKTPPDPRLGGVRRVHGRHHRWTVTLSYRPRQNAPFQDRAPLVTRSGSSLNTLPLAIWACKRFVDVSSRLFVPAGTAEQTAAQRPFGLAKRRFPTCTTCPSSASLGMS